MISNIDTFLHVVYLDVSPHLTSYMAEPLPIYPAHHHLQTWICFPITAYMSNNRYKIEFTFRTYVYIVNMIAMAPWLLTWLGMELCGAKSLEANNMVAEQW